MAKKKNKIDVPTSSDRAVLAHNPFAALAGATAPEQEPAPDAGPSAVNEVSRPQRSRGRLILRRETKHRGGKAVVVVSGLESCPALDDAARAELLQYLKQQLGCGGTHQDKDDKPELVIQGDQPARVAELLRARGFRVDGVTA